MVRVSIRVTCSFGQNSANIPHFQFRKFGLLSACQMVAFDTINFFACYCQIADLTLTLSYKIQKNSADLCPQADDSTVRTSLLLTCVMASECPSATLVINFINLLELCSPGKKLCSFLFESKLTLRSM